MNKSQTEVSELLQELYTYFVEMTDVVSDDDEMDAEEDFRLRIAAILNT